MVELVAPDGGVENSAENRQALIDAIDVIQSQPWFGLWNSNHIHIDTPKNQTGCLWDVIDNETHWESKTVPIALGQNGDRDHTRLDGSGYWDQCQLMDQLRDIDRATTEKLFKDFMQTPSAKALIANPDIAFFSYREFNHFHIQKLLECFLLFVCKKQNKTAAIPLIFRCGQKKILPLINLICTREILARKNHS